LESFDLGPFYGAGVLSLTRYLQDAKHPFTGQTALLNGSLAKDLANHYMESEQIASAFHLSIKFNRQGRVIGAGGLFLQALPQADDSLLTVLETRVAKLPSLGDWSEARESPERLLNREFSGYNPRILDNRRIEFHCPCTRERMGRYIRMMSQNELADILDKGPFPVEVTCHFCSSRYQFERAEIERFHSQYQAVSGKHIP
jgi:molecular chaperone Hsp33